MERINALLYADGTPVSIEIVDGKIKNVITNAVPTGKAADNIYVAPGLIDNQVNGYISVEFTSDELTVEQMRKATRALWKMGVTTYLPTVITASREKLLKAFTVLARARRDQEIGQSIPGFHLEGPYISPQEGYRGVHNQKHIRPPDWDEFAVLNKAAENKIFQITIAPEVEGAVEFNFKCVNEGIIVALGHHNASAQDIRRAVEAGATAVTHLGNGCANTIHRFKNPLWMQLAEDRLTASMILDGFHLLPEIVKVFYRAKGPERLVLTSDITQLAGMPPGKYIWDGKHVVLTPEGVLKYPKENVFAGASLPLTTGVENIMRFTSCPLKEAVDMVTRNPARLYGFTDRGEIKAGMRADLILFKLNGYELNIQKTYINGIMVYDRSD